MGLILRQNRDGVTDANCERKDSARFFFQGLKKCGIRGGKVFVTQGIKA